MALFGGALAITGFACELYLLAAVGSFLNVVAVAISWRLNDLVEQYKKR